MLRDDSPGGHPAFVVPSPRPHRDSDVIPGDEQDDESTTTGFVVRGMIDGHPSVARWVNGRLVAEPELVRRAQVMVAMGEYFGSEHDPSHVVMASLEGGDYAVMLTVMRAFSRVTSVELPIDDGAGRPPR